MNRSAIVPIFAFLALAGGLGALPAHAQDSTTSNVQGPRDIEPLGPAELREFELPGTLTTPKESEPVVIPGPPPPTVTEQEPPASRQEPAQPSRVAEPVETRREAPASDTAAPSSAPDTVSETTPQGVAADEVTAEPAVPLPLPSERVAEPPAADIPEPEPTAGGNSTMLAIGVGLAALLGLALFFGYRRRRQEPGDNLAHGLVDEPQAPETPAARMPDPVPAAPRAPAPSAVAPVGTLATAPANGAAAKPAMAAAPAAEPEPRPWLELEFIPDRAAATDARTEIQYELVVRNVGNGAARNVRVEARMFNAGAEQDKEIGAFYAKPDPGHSRVAPKPISARSLVRFKSVVAMPKEQAREISIAGRRLFIPIVAFNVTYEWGENGRGQTSKSYLVGREVENPLDKMAPFRLDQGPRVYRSVGQRQNKLVRMV